MKKLADLIAGCEARAARVKRAPLPEEARLPQWPDSIRAVPNAILRSSLFSATGRGRRRYAEGEPLAALDGIEIYYTGQRLGQDDLDVWENLLHAVRSQSLGEQCRVTSYSLLKLIGLTDTGKNRAALQKRIERLVAAALTIRQGRYIYIGSLIRSSAKDEKTQEWVIELDPHLRPLFDEYQFTQVDWRIRRSLNGKPLAQWLHSFYSSHAAPFPFKVRTLHQLCGSEAVRMDHYRQDLRKALLAVKEACAAHGKWFRYEVCDDLVYVERQASGSQRRHLIKKKAKLT
mgnify:CR=1 FL=1